MAQIFGYVFEQRFVLHILIRNMVDGCSFRRNRHTRIYTNSLFLFLSIRKNLDIGYFNNSILRDIYACRFKVKKYQRIS